MSRQPPLRPADLSPAQADLYATIAGGRRAEGPQLFPLVSESGELRGPFGGFLLAPAVGDSLQRLGSAIRYESGLGDRLRELAILAVAARSGSGFEWSAHEPVGRAAGVTDDELAEVRAGGTPEPADPREAAGLRFAAALLDGDVDDETWAATVPPLSEGDVLELVALVGYYSTLALQMRVLRVDSALA